MAPVPSHRRLFALVGALTLAAVAVLAVALVGPRPSPSPAVPTGEQAGQSRGFRVFMSPARLRSVTPDQVSSVEERGWLGTEHGGYHRKLTEESVPLFLDAVNRMPLGLQEGFDSWAGGSSSFRVTLADGGYFDIDPTPSQLVVNGTPYGLLDEEAQWDAWLGARSRFAYYDVYEEWAEQDPLGVAGLVPDEELSRGQ